VILFLSDELQNPVWMLKSRPMRHNVGGGHFLTLQQRRGPATMEHETLQSIAQLGKLVCHCFCEAVAHEASFLDFTSLRNAL